MDSCSIVVPVHNGETNIHSLIQAIENLSTPPGELILVDDGSQDDSWNRIKLASMNPGSTFRIRGVRLGRNRGQQSALLAGLTLCDDRIIITMDDDLSHPPNFIPMLHTAIDDGADLVYADPPVRPGGKVRSFVSSIHQLHMNFLTGSRIGLRVGSYRGMSSGLVQRVMDSQATWPYLSAMALELRPRPVTAMLPSADWNRGMNSRLSLSVLIRLELSLAIHHGPIARMVRSIWPKPDATCRMMAESWISERTAE